MSALGNVSVIRSSVASDAGDALHIATLSRLTSVPATRGLAQIASHWVGTKMHIVTSWRASSASALSGSKPVVGVITPVAPSTRNGSRPLMPPIWNIGWPDSQTSSAAGAHLVNPAERARDEVAVTEHRTLWSPGRAGRVAEQREVVLEQWRLLCASW